MIRFQLGEDINNAQFPCGTPFNFQAGIEYVCESQTAAVICAIVGGNMAMEPVKIAKRVGAIPSSILIVRGGGAGDILFLTPVLAELRRRFPSAYVGLACVTRYHWVLSGNKNVDGLFDVPLPTSQLGRFDWIIDLEESVELDNERHVVDIFAEKAGITVTDKATSYSRVTDLAEFEKQFPKTKKRVGIQLKASSPVRTYPRVIELQKKFGELGWERILFAARGEFTPMRQALPGLISTAETDWSWQKTTDFAATCDLIVGPDSSLIHFAGAMGIPAIALYGSFDSSLRLVHGSTRVLQSKRECVLAPCAFHGRRGQVFPVGGPCNNINMCAPLASISPDDILSTAAEMGL